MRKCIKLCKSAKIKSDEGKISIMTAESYWKQYKTLEGNFMCHRGHKMVLIKDDGDFFFEHENIDMCCTKNGEWHTKWQENFYYTEINFCKKNRQIKYRYADAHIPNLNRIIEFQYSYIDKEEVLNRKNDYALHKKDVIWIINGNDGINVTNLEKIDRTLVEFVNEWKYKSFLDYEYVFLDVNDKIYCVNPKIVKNSMADVCKPINKKNFISLLKFKKDIFSKEIPMQCKLYLKQQGAGNGKTFGIVQKLADDAFLHYDKFIILTKMHSAKHVISTEIKKQYDDKFLPNMKNLKIEEINNGKHVTVSYIINGKEYRVLIGTMDSFMYNIGDRDVCSLDNFKGIVNSLIDTDYISGERGNSITFARQYIKMNKKICIIIDETQDLSIDYAKAIIEIMRNKYVDCYIVGDRLQSITYDLNAFTYFLDKDREFPYIDKIIEPYTNICRRFKDPKLIEFVNKMIDFKKFDLPNVTPESKTLPIGSSLCFFKGSSDEAIHENNELINTETTLIMDHYIREVDNGHIPEDFLIITPYTKNNPLMNSLETAINKYWINKNGGQDKYIKYAIFHKSEEGSSIKLGTSDKATRMVSIHTSKGDGRKIVFVIGLDEQKLRRFSKQKDNLVYNSLLHVALTRMKSKMYIRYVDKQDDICRRLGNYCKENNMNIDIKPKIDICRSTNYNDMIDSSKDESFYNYIVKEFGDSKAVQNILESKIGEEKQIMEMSHHNIRYASMVINLYIKIIGNKNCNFYMNDARQQIGAIFKKIRDSQIKQCCTWEEYNDCLKKNRNRDEKDSFIAILKMSDINSDQYNKYYNIICEFIEKIKMDIKNYINGKKVMNICPLESVLLYYIIETVNSGIYSDITIGDIYNMIDIYSNSFCVNIKGHDDCKCKLYFKQKTISTENNNDNYIFNHYEKMEKLLLVYDKFLKDHVKVKWVLNHKLLYDGNTVDTLDIYNRYDIIGYDDENVYIVYVKPQYNELNKNYVLIDSFYDTFFIGKIGTGNIYLQNNGIGSEKIISDKQKFKNKKIQTVIFSLNNENYCEYNWMYNRVDLLKDKRKMIVEKIKEKILNKYLIESQQIHNFYAYWVNMAEKKNDSLQIIENIVLQYKKNILKNSRGQYGIISQMFNNMQSKIEDETAEENRRNIINRYLDYDFFTDTWEKAIKRDINYYFEDDE